MCAALRKDFILLLAAETLHSFKLAGWDKGKTFNGRIKA